MGPDGNQRRVAKMRQNPRTIQRPPRSNPPHRRYRKRHCARHRHVKPYQPLQAFRPPAMGGRGDICRRCDLGKIGDRVEFLHCGTFLVSGAAYADRGVTQGIGCARGQRPGVSHPRTPVGYLGRKESGGQPSILVRSATGAQAARMRWSRFRRLRRMISDSALTCTVSKNASMGARSLASAAMAPAKSSAAIAG